MCVCVRQRRPDTGLLCRSLAFYCTASKVAERRPCLVAFRPPLASSFADFIVRSPSPRCTRAFSPFVFVACTCSERRLFPATRDRFIVQVQGAADIVGPDSGETARGPLVVLNNRADLVCNRRRSSGTSSRYYYTVLWRKIGLEIFKKQFMRFAFLRDIMNKE